MKSEKILETISKLQKLSPKQLDLIASAINSCLVVQSLEKASKSQEALHCLMSNPL